MSPTQSRSTLGSKICKHYVVRGSSSILIIIAYHFLLKGRLFETLKICICKLFWIYYAHKLKFFFPTHTLLKQFRSLGFISVNACHLSISLQGIIWLLSSDLSISREEEDTRKAHGKAFEHISAVVTFLWSIYSAHGGLWSVSMALTQKEPGICCCLALTSEWSRDILPLSVSTQEEFEVSALWKTHTVKFISGAPLRAMDTSGFSHLSLKAVCEGLFALYPHLQRASWDSRSSMRKCYHLWYSLLILHSCNCFKYTEWWFHSFSDYSICAASYLAPTGGQYHLQYNQITKRP